MDAADCLAEQLGDADHMDLVAAGLRDLIGGDELLGHKNPDEPLIGKREVCSAGFEKLLVIGNPIFCSLLVIAFPCGENALNALDAE